MLVGGAPTSVRAERMLIGLAAVIVAACAVVVRNLPVTSHLLLFAAALSPYLALGSAALAAVSALTRRWRATLLTALGAGAALAQQTPLYLPAVAPPGDIGLRVITANLYEGRADARSVVRSARSTAADVVTVQELTAAEVGRLSAAGIDTSYPFRWLGDRVGAYDVGIWSRYPLRDGQVIKGYDMALISARVHVEGLAADPTIVVAHMPGPWPQPIEDWRRDLDRLPGTLSRSGRDPADGAVLVTGDFNATNDMRPFRNVLGSGYRDAAEQAGAGITRTYPAGRSVPPLLAIDHILTRGATAISVHTFDIVGSDHRGLVADIRLPAPEPSSGQAAGV